MALNLKQLEAFVWVADLGSFRGAADRLNTTQPNISSRIASLEAALDTKLMDRDAGSVRLTAKGEELLVEARTVLRSTERLIEVAGQQSLVDGVLRLGVTEMIVHAWLRNFLKSLRESMPLLRVELTVDLSVNLSAALFDRSIDLAFQSGPFSRTTSGEEELGTYPMVWVASPDLGLPKKLTSEQLAQQPILTHAGNTRPYEELAEHFLKSGTRSAQLVPSSNLGACLHMAVEGMGCAAVPLSMVGKELRSGELVQIDCDWTPSPLYFLARYDKERAPGFVGRAAQTGREIAQLYDQEN